MEHALALFFPQAELQQLFSRTLARLVLAAVLGGIIGLEREFKHRAAGLRTNMFICFGAAMFTVLSMDLAQGNEATRIASQIIPGIGFIGAGSILRDKGGVTGLTTAATIFVVASIGMACGGGLYLMAIFSTLLIIVALLLLGGLETRLSLKPFSISYAITTDKSADEVVQELNSVLEEQDRDMQRMRVSKVNGKTKIIFSMDCTRSEHKQLADRMRQSADLRNFDARRDHEVD
ncbi:MAG TPA: MgtC/SapB family protein [Candidatus Angelobacter sp.]